MASTDVTAHTCAVYRVVVGFSAGDRPVPVHPHCLGAPAGLFAGNQSRHQARRSCIPQSARLYREYTAKRAAHVIQELRRATQAAVRAAIKDQPPEQRGSFAGTAMSAVDDVCGSALDLACADAATPDFPVAVALQKGLRESPDACRAVPGMVLGVYAECSLLPTEAEAATIAAWRATCHGLGDPPATVDRQSIFTSTSVAMLRAPTAAQLSALAEFLDEVKDDEVGVEFAGSDVVHRGRVVADVVVAGEILRVPFTGAARDDLVRNQCDFETTPFGATLYTQARTLNRDAAVQKIVRGARALSDIVPTTIDIWSDFIANS